MYLYSSQYLHNIYTCQLMFFKDFKMPKDKVLSTKTFIISHLVILMLALGFFAGLYYILYPERFKKAVMEYNPVTREPISLFLEITSPEDDILVNDGNLIISGKTGPEAAVVISSNQSDAGLQADKYGQFSKVFPLILGANIIEITSFDPEGNSKTVTKSVYYQEEKI